MIFVYARHGQTSTNKLGIFQGQHIQGELSEEGKNQAKNLGEKISKIFQFDEIFCSPINRAKQTLLEILPFQKTKNIKYYDLCKEINRGEFEGKPVKEVNEFIKNSGIQFRDFKTPDSESYKDVYLRCQKFLEEIIQKYVNKNFFFEKLPEDKDLVEEEFFVEKFEKGELTNKEKINSEDFKKVLLVSHWGYTKELTNLIMYHLTGKILNRFFIKNCGIFAMKIYCTDCKGKCNDVNNHKKIEISMDYFNHVL